MMIYGEFGQIRQPCRHSLRNLQRRSAGSVHFSYIIAESRVDSLTWQPFHSLSQVMLVQKRDRVGAHLENKKYLMTRVGRG